MEVDWEELLLRLGGNNESGPFPKLPADISVDILSRLPGRTLAICRCVCKTWNKTTRHPRFMKMHSIKVMAQQPYCTNSILFHVKDGEGRSLDDDKYKCTLMSKSELGSDIHLLDHDGDGSKNVFKNGDGVALSPLFNDKHNSGLRFDVVGSCNGLVCLSHTSALGYDPIFICNPVVGEYVQLPKMLYYTSDFDTVSGFGFDQITKEYKVIRMHYEDLDGDEDEEGEDYILVLEVYTLGSGKWRCLGEVPYFLRRNYTQVFVNGVLHWQPLEYFSWEIESASLPPSEYIVAFDVHDEEFSVIEHPPVNYRSCLGDLGGQLCLLDHAFVDWCVVWVMKEYGVDSSWTRDYTITRNVPRFNGSFCSMTLMSNGNVLMVDNDQCLICYDPATRRFSIPWFDKIQQVNSGIPHVRSSISLREIVGSPNSNHGVNSGKCYRSMPLIPIQPREEETEMEE